MKKRYRKVLDSSYKDLNTLIVSAGKIGHQIELAPNDLIKLINCTTESITVKIVKTIS